MQPNYEAEARKRQQQQYQQTRNPFELGQQVAQRRYSEIMSGLDNQMRATQQSYGDMYQAARQRAVGSQAMGGPTLSGGMGQQRRDFVSALEMQELSRIGGAQQQALADIAQQRQSAFSNAQLEGQQATQMELQNRQAELGLLQQKQAILDSEISQEQKQEQLEALGIEYTSEDITGTTSPITGLLGGAVAIGSIYKLAASGVFGTTIGVKALDLGAWVSKIVGPTVKAGGVLAKMGPLGKVLGIAGKAVPWLAAAWGIEKLIELIQGKGSEGGLIGSEGLIRLGNFNI